MANKDHIAELLKGVASWNEWIARQRAADPNFRADLSGLDLSEDRFKQSLYVECGPCDCASQFSCRQPALVGIDLRRAMLAYTSFYGANLTDALLERAILWDVHLEGGCLVRARLEGAQLQGAHLEGAVFGDAFLVRAGLGGPRLEGVQLEEAHLERVILEGASLKRAILCKAHLEGTVLRRAHLEGTVLWGAHLEGADFGAAHLEGADFFEAHLEGADLQGADFSNANMQGVSYNGFSLWTWLYHVLLRLIGRTPPPVSRYQGIYVETCRGNQRFQRFAKDQAYLEELRYSRKWWERAWFWTWLVLSDCGRSLLAWSFWSLVIAGLFGLYYAHSLGPGGAAAAPHVALNMGEAARNATWFTPYYYSIVTFTTLGFGDVVPVDIVGEFVVTFEVILGYLMLGGLISIFAEKLAKRSG